MNIWFIGAALLIGLGLFVVVRTLVQGTPKSNYPDMTQHLRYLTGEINAVEAEQSGGTFGRPHVNMTPYLEQIGQRMSQNAKEYQISSLEERLAAAGGFGNLTPQGFIGLQAAIAVSGVVVALLFSLLLGSDPLTTLLLVVAGAAVGYIGPRYRLSAKIKRRKNEILEHMPNALDLLTISVEAGLGMDAAMLRVAEKYKNALSEEFALVLSEMKLGRSRKDALMSMADRVEVDDLTSFIQAVLQSETMGVSLANTLRIQSEDLRRRRRQRAQMLGAQAPVKMLLPMVGCIFPTLFIVLLGPAVIAVTKSVAS